MADEDVLLRIEGQVEEPLALTYADLAGMDDSVQVADVSQLAPQRQGRAVRLSGLLARAGVDEAAQFVTFRSSADDFCASVPLDAVRDRALVIYGQENRPLSPAVGGPTRLIIPGAAPCQIAEIDTCANVKHLARIELMLERGADTRRA